MWQSFKTASSATTRLTDMVLLSTWEQSQTPPTLCRRQTPPPLCRRLLIVTKASTSLHCASSTQGLLVTWQKQMAVSGAVLHSKKLQRLYNRFHVRQEACHTWQLQNCRLQQRILGQWLHQTCSGGGVQGRGHTQVIGLEALEPPVYKLYAGMLQSPGYCLLSILSHQHPTANGDLARP